MGADLEGIRALQLRSLGLLEAIDKVCRSHNLTYYMAYGTLLGAIRHKGFIPWDDDIDVAMPRRDYDILLSNASEWLDYPYTLITYSSNPYYSRYFAKLEDRSTTVVERFHMGRVGGLYLDIFPLDNVPDNAFIRFVQYRRFHRLNKLLYYAYRDPYKHGHGLGSLFWSSFQKMLSRDRLHERIQRVVSRYKDRTDCHLYSTHDDGLKVFPINIMGIPVEYEFEGHRFWGPADYDSFLKIMYGPDYMLPPPPELRITHGFEYVDFNSGYEEADFEELKRKHAESVK